MRHQAWSDGSFFPVVNRSARTLVEADATVLWEVDAATWVEAMSRYHAWRSWAPYRPMDDDLEPYTAEQEAEAAAMGIAESTVGMLTEFDQGNHPDV